MRRIRVSKKRLYFKEIKREKAPGIKKDVTGQLKSTVETKYETLHSSNFSLRRGTITR
jgi:hypothetical protein